MVHLGVGQSLFVKCIIVDKFNCVSVVQVTVST